MSGGAFDYNQYRIREIAEDIRRFIARNGKTDEHGWKQEFPADIIEKFKEAEHTLERAADMTQRVDWLVSGDDGEDCFRRRWNEEVRKPYEAKS